MVTDAFSSARTPGELFAKLGWWVRLGLGVGAAGYVFGWLLLRRGSAWGKTAGIATLSVATILMLQAIYSGSDVFRATRSTADLVTTLENAANPPYDRSAPFFQVHMYDQTLPFYLARTTTLVEYRDELGPGLDARAGARHRARGGLDRALEGAAAGVRADVARHARRASRGRAFRCA